MFITNQMSWSAQTVADIYKARWEVELFFKWIKQNLKIKSFLGNTINAVASQIFVALCLYLLIAFQKFVSRTRYGLQALFLLVQLNAFAVENGPVPSGCAPEWATRCYSSFIWTDQTSLLAP